MQNEQNTTPAVKLWMCPLCRRKSDSQDEIQEHIILAHQIYPHLVEE